MGVIFSRTVSNLVEDAVLRFARLIDSISRRINRSLSAVSSFCFSKLFGYDLVFADDSNRAEAAVCVPGNVCLVPVSTTQNPRQDEKRRRSDRRKRAEAAAMGRDALKKHREEQQQLNRRDGSAQTHLAAGLHSRHPSNESRASAGFNLRTNAAKKGYTKVADDALVSPCDEKAMIMKTLGPVAIAPAPRPAHERETAAEKAKGKLWVMGNIKPSSNGPVHLQQPDFYDPDAIDPKTPVRASFNPLDHLPHLAKSRAEKEADRVIDAKVVQRMMEQRHVANTVVIKQAIQPRRSSKSTAALFAGAAAQASSGAQHFRPDPIAESTEVHADAHIDSAHLTTRKVAQRTPHLHQPVAKRIPPGALALVPPPLEGPFRHPFADPIPADSAAAAPVMTSKAKQVLQKHHNPRLSLDTNLEGRPTMDDSLIQFKHHEEDSVAPLSISRPSSGASNRIKVPLPRRSMDAISLRSFRSDSVDSAAIDVKTLATKAVKEGRERKGWKDEVNKFAMQKCLQQQQHGENLRRFSAASLTPQSLGVAAGRDKALQRVRTQEGIRRGSSPNLYPPSSLSGRSTPIPRTQSPLQTIY